MKISIDKPKEWVPINLVIESEAELMFLIRVYGATHSHTNASYHNAMDIYQELKSIANDMGVQIYNFEKYKLIKLAVN